MAKSKQHQVSILRAYHFDHLADEILCSDEIQLLEGPILWPFPCTRFGDSVDCNGLEEFPLELPAGVNDEVAMRGSFRAYIINIDHQ